MNPWKIHKPYPQQSYLGGRPRTPHKSVDFLSASGKKGTEQKSHPARNGSEYYMKRSPIFSIVACVYPFGSVANPNNEMIDLWMTNILL